MFHRVAALPRIIQGTARTITSKANDPLVTVSRDSSGHILTFTLNRPTKGNSLSVLLLQQLKDHLASIDKQHKQKAKPNNNTNPGAPTAEVLPHVAILRGSGHIFCAGHDLKELHSLQGIPGQSAKEIYHEVFKLCNEVMMSIHRSPLIFIAQVNGIATAAGCQLVAACDLAVASEDATFATPGVNIGLFCTTPSVPIGRTIARKHAMEMLLTGKPVSADTALRFGLINWVVPKAALEQETMELAQEIAGKPADVLGLGKRAFYDQMERRSLGEAYDFAGEVMAENMVMKNTKEGISAFLEKRKPTWEN